MIRDDLASAADRARWQTRNLTILADVITAGSNAGLPTLAWSVSDIGTLRAEIPAGTADPARVFYCWAVLLGADNEAVHSGVVAGRVHLRTHIRRVLGTSVMVSLSARFDAVAEVTR